MAFTHIAPGIVRTALTRGQSGDWLMNAFYPLTTALGYVLGNSADDCGEYMWHGVYGAKAGTAGRFNRHGEDIGDRYLWSPPGAKEKVWEHTLKETSK